MSDIVQFASGPELLQMIEALNAQVAGMSTAEAAAALQIADAGRTVAFNVIQTAGGEIISFANATAAEAFELYEAAAGYVNSMGAASVEQIAMTGNFTEIITFGGGGAATGTAALLTASIPAWVAIAVPLIGLAVGVAVWYAIDPEFFEDLVDRIKAYCWPGTEAMPIVVDSTGQAYLEGDALEELKRFLEERAVYTNGYTSALNTGIWTQPIPASSHPDIVQFPIYPAYDVYSQTYDNSCYQIITIAPTNGKIACLASMDGNRIRITPIITGNNNVLSNYSYSVRANTYRVSDNSLVSSELLYTASQVPSLSSYTNGGVTVYYSPIKLGFSQEVDFMFSPLASIIDIWTNVVKNLSEQYTPLNNGAAAWTVQRGTYVEKNDHGFSEYEGNTPVDYTLNKIEVVTDTSLNTAPYYPVRLPIGDPFITNDPTEVPDPTSPSTPIEIEPFIEPEINITQYPEEIPIPTPEERTAPLENPVPGPSPEFNPDVDPSEMPVPDPEPAEEIPGPPISGGLSPSPLPDFPNFPSIVPSGNVSGFIHVYNPTPNEMIAFGRWLWVTYGDATIDKIWNNPFDGILGAQEIYITPATGSPENIRSGFLVSTVQSKIVPTRYITINCGSIVIPEYYGSYLDYSPYSKAHVYLPFVGIVELDVDDIVGHAVNILYHVDTYNGSCIAQITVARTDYSNTVYQFSGNCAVDIPLSGGSQAAIKAGMISAAATGIASVIGGVATALTGNIAGAVGGIAYGIGGAISHAVSQKSSVQHSGTFGASYGAMGIKKPYIIIRRPVQKIVYNYNKDYGLPAHKRVIIGSCHGFLRVREVNVISPSATDEEKARIEELLKEGVYVD